MITWTCSWRPFAPRPSSSLGSQTPFGLTCGAGFRQVKPVKITTAVPDPLANVNAPGYSAPTACPGGGVTVLSITTANVASFNPLTPALAAGHCGGVKITDIPASTNFRIQPGTYYGTLSGASGTDAVFTIVNSSVTFNLGSYDLYNNNTSTSSSPSAVGVRVNSGFFGQSQRTFRLGITILSAELRTEERASPDRSSTSTVRPVRRTPPNRRLLQGDCLAAFKRKVRVWHS